MPSVLPQRAGTRRLNGNARLAVQHQERHPNTKRSLTLTKRQTANLVDRLPLQVGAQLLQQGIDRDSVGTNRRQTDHHQDKCDRRQILLHDAPALSVSTT